MGKVEMNFGHFLDILYAVFNEASKDVYDAERMGKHKSGKHMVGPLNDAKKALLQLRKEIRVNPPKSLGDREAYPLYFHKVVFEGHFLAAPTFKFTKIEDADMKKGFNWK